jgi:hypothetical protein
MSKTVLWVTRGFRDATEDKQMEGLVDHVLGANALLNQDCEILPGMLIQDH